jgi:hypothetical protein
MSEPKLRLSLIQTDRDACICIEALETGRFENYGHGAVMCNVMNGEVDITEEARQALLDLPERRGVQGILFWTERRMAWGSTAPRFLVALKHISVPLGAKGWIKQLGVTPSRKRTV